MLIYKIPTIYSTNQKNNSAIREFTLAIIKTQQAQDICLFTLNTLNATTSVDELNQSFITFPENSLKHFSSLLSKYNAELIKDLPSFVSVSVIYGDASIVSKIANH
jgi:hypothetical protein